MATRPPTVSGQSSSTAASSKVSVDLCSTVSPGWRPCRHCIQRIRLTQPVCVQPTAFGVPVDPDVKYTAQSWSGCRGGGGVRSAAGGLFVSRTVTPAAARTASTRAGGVPVSTGTNAAPARSTPSTMTARSSDRSTITATRSSGRTPCPRSHPATPSAAASSSA